MKEEVARVLKEIRPLFKAHQGDFEVVEVGDNGIVKLKLVGSCELCVLKEKTAAGLEGILRKEVPGFQGIEIL